MATPTLVVLRLLATTAAVAAVAGCVASRYSDRVYLYQRPVQGIRSQAVTISEPDWSACDRAADRAATTEYDDARIRQAITANPGGIQGAVLLVAAVVTTRGKPEPELLRAQRDKTYEESMRRCLSGRGYPVEAPPASYADSNVAGAPK